MSYPLRWYQQEDVTDPSPYCQQPLKTPGSFLLAFLGWLLPQALPRWLVRYWEKPKIFLWEHAHRQAVGGKEPFGQQFHHWDKMKDTVEVRPTEVWGKGQFAVPSSADRGCVWASSRCSSICVLILSHNGMQNMSTGLRPQITEELASALLKPMAN